MQFHKKGIQDLHRHMLHLSKFLSRSHTISNRWVIRLLQTLFPLLAIFLNNSSWITAKFLPFISDFQEKRAWKYIALQCTTIPWSVDLSLCSSFLNERSRVENSTLELLQKNGGNIKCAKWRPCCSLHKQIKDFFVCENCLEPSYCVSNELDYFHLTKYWYCVWVAVRE